MHLPGFLKNRTIKNAGWLIGGQLANKLLAFLVGILTARYLGPSNFGLINYAAAYITFFASVCTLGINSVIVKNLVDHPEEEGVTMGTTLVLQTVSSLLSAVMIVGIVSVVDRGEPETILVAALSSVSLFFQVFGSLRGWFQAHLQSKYAAIASVTAYMAVSAYKILLLIFRKSVVWFALANAVDYLVVAVFLVAAYRRKGGPAFSFSAGKARQLLASSVSFIISGLMVSIYASTDKLMLKQMLSETAVAHYSLAVSVSSTWTFILSAIIESMYPSIAQLHGTDRAAYLRRNRQLYAIVFYSSLAMSLLVTVFAEPFVEIFYGTQYLPSVRPLRIVVWYTAFSYLGVARNAWMVCENRQKYLKYLYMSAAAINVVLNLVLIPVWGAAGAALASLLTQISTTMVLPALMKPLRENANLMFEAIRLHDVLPMKKNIRQKPAAAGAGREGESRNHE